MRAQATLEFSIMIMFAMTIMISLLLIVSYYTVIVSNERAQTQADGLADLLQKELLIAASVPDGYERTITLPPKIDRYLYSVSLSGNILEVAISDDIISNRYIPQVSGGFSLGNNVLTKENNNLVVS